MVTSRRAAVALEPGRGDADNHALDALHARVLGAGGSIDAAIRLAIELGATAPRPGEGSTGALWATLATVAAADVSVARVVEPHLDAIAILAQAPAADFDLVGAGDDSSWGVFAAEGAGVTVAATSHDGGWVLDGVKPWCSLAGRLSHALVTAHTPGGGRRLFAIDLAHEGVRAGHGEWFARGLPRIESGPIALTTVPAVPVGDDGWYLSRPGFAWGGIGVAAVWWGAAIGVARTLGESVRAKDPDQIALMHLGATDLHIEIGRLAIAAAAAIVDRGASGQSPADRDDMRILAHRTRSIVASAAEEVVRRCGHALGPAPLALDAGHAARVADLELYLRQDHAERDEAALGRALLAREASPW